jgi:hypothetical protein
MAYINIRPMPAFPKEEIVSAKTPVEVTAIRQKNAIHLVRSSTTVFDSR